MVTATKQRYHYVFFTHEVSINTVITQKHSMHTCSETMIDLFIPWLCDPIPLKQLLLGYKHCPLHV